MGGRTPVPQSLPYRCRFRFREGPDDQHQQHNEQQPHRQGRARHRSAAQREAADAVRAAKIAALHDQIGEQVEALTADPQWRAMLDAAAKFHTCSLGDQLLIELQAARPGFSPTRVTGFGTWKVLGRSVVEGSTGLAVPAPCTYTPKRTDTGTDWDPDQAALAATTAAGTAGELAGGDADQSAGAARVLRGCCAGSGSRTSSTSPGPTATRCPTSSPNC